MEIMQCPCLKQRMKLHILYDIMAYERLNIMDIEITFYNPAYVNKNTVEMWMPCTRLHEQILKINTWFYVVLIKSGSETRTRFFVTVRVKL